MRCCSIAGAPEAKPPEMLHLFRHRDYLRLFLAQIISLLGTGLSTVALSLLAFDLAAEQAGSVLGTALVIKMLTYIFLSPVAQALVERWPRKVTLITLDLWRAGIALSLPFVSTIGQIYILIFLLQSASAAFTPAFQATIPDILTDEEEYTRALSLSRLAYDLENLISPGLAALLLGFLSFYTLFVFNSLSFVVSGLLIVWCRLPGPTANGGAFWQRLFGGLSHYWRVPDLRAMWWSYTAVAAAGALVLVNTVVWVQGRLHLSEQATATALMCFGFGSMLSALCLPRVLRIFSDRLVILANSTGLLLALCCATATRLHAYPLLLLLWGIMGFNYGAAQLPIGRLIQRNGEKQQLAGLFAAHFALSHACWLVTYAVAGWGGSWLGLPASTALLTGLAATGVVVSWRSWPRRPEPLWPHSHPDLPPEHPHWQEGKGEHPHHAHPIHFDRLHVSPFWEREPSGH